MVYDFSQARQNIDETREWLGKEYTSLRTGRAAPALLDGVMVESYGTRVPLNQVGSVGTEDARTLRVTPWDASQVKEVEKAITEADLGVSVVPDEAGVRIVFPELTSERREQLIKVAREKLEQARVSLRQERDRVLHDIQAKEKEGEFGEDDRFRFKEELQKLIDEANKELEATLKRKEEEIHA